MSLPSAQKVPYLISYSIRIIFSTEENPFVFRNFILCGKFVRAFRAVNGLKV